MAQLKNEAASRAYVKYTRTRLKRKVSICIQLVLLIAFTIILWYQQYVGFENGNVGIQIKGYKTTERMFYELPLLLFASILAQILLYNAEHIPGLKKWQDKLERREFTRLKNSYEYQYK